ncbi:MAG: alpha/beta hydrolase [Rudaea sp.]
MNKNKSAPTLLKHAAVAACLFLGIAFCLPACAAAPHPPAQPAQGPGGASYPHARVVAREVKSGGQGWWLFTPADPVPASAPVVVFCHGWGAMNPKTYRAWIDHIVRRGNIVIYPNYQASLLTPGDEFLPNAVAALRASLVDLQDSHGGIRPDLNRVAVVGHSAGGVLSAELAAVAKAEGLPPMRAVMAVAPGDGSRNGRRRATVPTIDLSPMPTATLLLVVVGADDHLAYEKPGLHIYDASVQVPASNKNVLELETDRHGSPPLIANHSAAGGTLDSRPARAGRALITDFEHAGMVDALDWYGTWKLFDALSDAAFYGRERNIALGGSPAQLSMGRWSDGVPVTPMRVLR